ncbi:hypothetical protein RFI_02917 [Reticulomyxa filosa]|uniref:CRAL-TRIO domain-containing protein n=1 Tax=Reticulomyxa filosa TaxID=46433 RepID=X6P7K1_RETFI|nr:hypothetical protein RFI_02917 [Reticulomyxa filosa]|eukprot:ETO34176.1 hypothetical protein RFI_02917 [Reticulomyxa filosa]
MIYKHVMVMDVSNASMTSLNKFKNLVQTVIAEEHGTTYKKKIMYVYTYNNNKRHLFPETLYKLYLVNSSFTFRAIWKIVSNFVDPITYQKINVLGGSYLDEMAKILTKMRYHKNMEELVKDRLYTVETVKVQKHPTKSLSHKRNPTPLKKKNESIRNCGYFIEKREQKRALVCSLGDVLLRVSQARRFSHLNMFVLRFTLCDCALSLIFNLLTLFNTSQNMACAYRLFVLNLSEYILKEINVKLSNSFCNKKVSIANYLGKVFDKVEAAHKPRKKEALRIRKVNPDNNLSTAASKLPPVATSARIFASASKNPMEFSCDNWVRYNISGRPIYLFCLFVL